MNGWIGVDLDGCLAEYHGWQKDGSIGPPVPRMVERVKKWISEGKQIKIFTARVCTLLERSGESGEVATVEFAKRQEGLIEVWCLEHIGQVLPVTCVKDFGMIELWDDRCIQVIPNVGICLDDVLKEI